MKLAKTILATSALLFGLAGGAVMAADDTVTGTLNGYSTYADLDYDSTGDQVSGETKFRDSSVLADNVYVLVDIYDSYDNNIGWDSDDDYNDYRAACTVSAAGGMYAEGFHYIEQDGSIWTADTYIETF